MAKRMSFKKWMRIVDGRVWIQAGCSVYDLPDCPYRDWFDRGMTPMAAARKAVKNAKGG